MNRPSHFFKYLWIPLYIFIQLTWGFFQSAVGFVLFLFYIRAPHDFYHGSIRTKWKTFNGISLGLFIFTPDEGEPSLLRYTRKNSQLLKDRCDKISVHEYGHTYQSLLLGPFYLLIIGVTSWSWAQFDRYKKLRKKYGVPYSYCWTEAWANHLGERVLKAPSIDH